ncbi:glycosyltransferase [Methanothermobacter marburgensis]|uniref:glycosyltransferase n=1 Tax=Methanothermobacter marburgensis TaxID=145263 RepID=UPI0035B702CC
MNILIIPHSIWTGMPGRFDCFINRLKKRNHVHVLSWDMPYPLNFENLKNFRMACRKFRRKIEKNVMVHHVSRPLVFPPFNRNIVGKQIKDIIREYDIDVIFSESFLWDFVPPFDEVPVIYDMVDDHMAFFRNSSISGKFMSKFSRVEGAVIDQLRNADHTFFVSSVLKERYGDMTEYSSVLSNGVDLELFNGAEPTKYAAKLSLDNYDCILGYVGYFGEWSNLFESVINLRNFLEKYNAAIIIAGMGPDVERLKSTLKSERLIFTGMMKPESIPSLLKTLDIGLLPFKKSPYTDAASPIKYFEYAAAGLKVVSSNLEEVKRIKFVNTVFFEDINSIENAAKEALNMDFNKSELKKSLRPYDWGRLSKQLENLMVGAYEHRGMGR